MSKRSDQNKPQRKEQQSRPARVPAELIAKIKNAVSIIDLVGEHVVLRQQGANWVGLCPFHNERSPSFSVHESKQLYHCYGCKEGGDIVNFVMEIHGLSFSEAVEELAARAQIALPADFSRYLQPGQSNAEMQKCFKLNRFVASYYRNQLLSQDSFAQHCRKYLQSRSSNELMLRNFYVGCAPHDWDQLTRFLIQSKSPMEKAEKLGLILPSKQKISGKPPFFDFLRNRIVFPILDTRGRVIAFSGRLLDGEGPKYLNSPDSMLYSKSKAAFGIYQAKRFIREADEVIVVEGQFDVLAMHQMGFQQTVATCGTALTADHIDHFQRLGKKLVILFDGDSAGQSAAERAMELGLRKGLAVLGAVLPSGQDPNDVLIKGQSQRVAELLKNARPLLDMAIDRELEKEKVQSAVMGASQAKVESLRSIASWLSQYSDALGREVRIQSLVEKAGFSAELLQKAIAQSSLPPTAQAAGPMKPVVQTLSAESQKAPSKAPTQRPPAPSGRSARPGVPQLSQLEKRLLRVLLQGTESQKLSIIDRISPNLPPSMTWVDCFADAQVRQFLGSLGFREGRFDATYFADASPQLRSLFTALLASPQAETRNKSRTGLSDFGQAQSAVVTENAEENLFWLDRILALVWARFSHELRRALASAEAEQNVDELKRLSQDYLDVQRKMKEFNSFYVKDSNP